MKNIAFIFARKGSKGLVNKNIKKINGIPLISHTINLIKKNRLIDDLYISTNDKRVLSIAKKNNVKFIIRPENLCLDKTPEWKAWQHAIKYLNKKNIFFKKFISLPVTSPLRNNSDINNCINALDDKTDFVVTYREASRNPWFNMVSINKNNNLKIINESKKIYRRQDAPQVYDLTTVAYVSTPQNIINKKKIFDGTVKGVKIPLERSIDIDNKYDFKVAELLIQSRNVK